MFSVASLISISYNYSSRTISKHNALHTNEYNNVYAYIDIMLIKEPDPIQSGVTRFLQNSKIHLNFFT